MKEGDVRVVLPILAAVSEVKLMSAAWILQP